jgi:ribonuclease HI
MLKYELFTDGACSGNPGPGGWGFILRGGDLPHELLESGGELGTTNNRMEMMAALQGLRWVFDQLLRPQEGAMSTVTVVSDSQYVVKGMTEWLVKWQKNHWNN